MQKWNVCSYFRLFFKGPLCRLIPVKTFPHSLASGSRIIYFLHKDLENGQIMKVLGREYR